jgi:RNA polymerase sigma-70 factor, ECF subfamily
MSGEEEKINTFNKHRSRLFGIAYRMLGTHFETEDILQEAYIKWHQTNAEEIETPEAWRVTINRVF